MPRLRPAVFNDSDIFIEGLNEDYFRLEARPVWRFSKFEEVECKAFETLDNLDLGTRPMPIVDVESRCPFKKYLSPVAITKAQYTWEPTFQPTIQEDKDVEMDDVSNSIHLFMSPCVNDADADGEIEMADASSAGEKSSVEEDSPKEWELIDELRIKAMALRDKVLERWSRKAGRGDGGEDFNGKREEPKIRTNKRGKKRTPDGVPKEGDAICNYRDCPWFFSTRAQSFNRHIHTHYPEAYFCPVCGEVACRDDSLDRHLLHKAEGKCIKSDSAKRYRISRGDDGKVKMGYDRKLFNFYFLGVLEDYEMSEEHFEIVARRRRGAPLYEKD
ncbi:hypothetical protein EW145_g2115 [Phellinidium pouzarii]|uniref:C2H2-type domain-containing protein n=1 Tax=Phellinidium pouzarii TaxID=167371 RepID=A0A4S4LHK8_9AGAM|nr:hypothetical protein EW145_g2115 [Phellinidium pouzarii]